ncbi:MAG: PHP domain-containing protein [Candidatus Bipolaricaulis sp.]|nr:PHP domain-containing protein [Candidatus Bipolaricaulis sp.]
MRTLVADLHIHTCLSPCASLRMSPRAIVAAARACGLDLIAVTDHNTAGMVEEVARAGRAAGLRILPGMELETREEVHLLAYFDDAATCRDFAAEIYALLPDRPNDPRSFGDQVVVDADETIVYVEPKLLLSALRLSLEEAAARIAALGGLAVPAHVDRSPYGLVTQLGFVPKGLRFPLVEVDGASRPAECGPGAVLWSSDAHTPEEIGSRVTAFRMNGATIDEIRRAALGLDGRSAAVRRRPRREGEAG